MSTYKRINGKICYFPTVEAAGAETVEKVQEEPKKETKRKARKK